MKVQDVMTSPAHSCTTETNLVGAAGTMWDSDCGALPVLDSLGQPVGIITDRDICMAVARKNRFPAEIPVLEVMSPYPFVCKASDDIEAALRVMAARQVRRLPVVDEAGRLIGIVSVNDVAADLRAKRSAARSADDVHRKVIETLLAVSAAARAPESRASA